MKRRLDYFWWLLIILGILLILGYILKTEIAEGKAQIYSITQEMEQTYNKMMLATEKTESVYVHVDARVYDYYFTSIQLLKVGRTHEAIELMKDGYTFCKEQEKILMDMHCAETKSVFSEFVVAYRKIANEFKVRIISLENVMKLIY